MFHVLFVDTKSSIKTHPKNAWQGLHHMSDFLEKKIVSKITHKMSLLKHLLLPINCKPNWPASHYITHPLSSIQWQTNLTNFPTHLPYHLEQSRQHVVQNAPLPADHCPPAWRLTSWPPCGDTPCLSCCCKCRACRVEGTTHALWVHPVGHSVMCHC